VRTTMTTQAEMQDQFCPRHQLGFAGAELLKLLELHHWMTNNVQTKFSLSYASTASCASTR
jgi:hypothetical protein